MRKFALFVFIGFVTFSSLFGEDQGNIAVSDKDLPKQPKPSQSVYPTPEKKQKNAQTKDEEVRDQSLPQRLPNLNKIDELAPEGEESAESDPNNPRRMGPNTNLNKIPSDEEKKHQDLNQRVRYQERGAEDPNRLGGPGEDLNKFDTPQEEKQQIRKPRLPSKKGLRKQQKEAAKHIQPKKELCPPVEEKQVMYESGVLIRKTVGLVLFSKREDLSLVDTSELRGFHAVNTPLPGKGRELDEILTPIYLNRPLTQKVIERLCAAIEQYYRDHDRPIVKVVVPRQGISHGVLSLLLIEGKLGKVTSRGNVWFSDELLTNYVKLEIGESIDERTLRENISFVNRNPFRTVEAVYSAGEKYQTTDIELLVKERNPFRIYTGSDNLGLSAINRTRFFVGANYGNLFGADQIISYQFTISKDFRSYLSQTMSYMIPFPWQHVLEFFGGYSSVETDVPLPFKQNKGNSMQISGRYTVPFGVFAKHSAQEFRIGFDFKRTNNTLEFVENYPVFGSTVVLSQVVLGYQCEVFYPHSKTTFEIDGYWSPGQIFNHQTNEDYQSLRDGAKNKWVYSRGELRQSFLFGRSGEILLRAAGQISTATLIPSEEFGVGGMETVRGYEERQLNGDNAFFASTEIKTPAFNGIIKPRTNREGVLVEDLWQLVLFCDYGRTWFKDTQESVTASNQTVVQPKAEFLLGAGPGLRYQIGNGLFARLDAGVKIHRKPKDWGGGNVMLHFMAMASF